MESIPSIPTDIAELLKSDAMSAMLENMKENSKMSKEASEQIKTSSGERSIEDIMKNFVPEDDIVEKVPEGQDLVKRISSTEDPSKNMMSSLEDMMKNISPDMIEQVKKMASGGGSIEDIMKKMMGGGSFNDVKDALQKQGIDMRAMQRSLLASQRKMTAKDLANGSIKKGLHIDKNRRISSIDLIKDKTAESAKVALKMSNPIELSCSRLARGPWEGKTIKVWYNPDAAGKNRLSSKIIGFPTGSDLIIVGEEDLSTQDLQTIKTELE